MPTEAEIDAVARAIDTAHAGGIAWEKLGHEWKSTCLDMAEAAIAALDAVRSQGRYRHKKRGSTYTLLGTAEVQASAPINEGEPVAVYRCDADGRLWVRPLSEFHDGRFDPLPQPPKEG